MRIPAIFCLVLILAGCASISEDRQQHLDDFIHWYNKPCSRC